MVKTRPLTQKDLPKKMAEFNSLHIPVMYKGKKMFICDINTVDREQVYLENNNGKRVNIKDLQLIVSKDTKMLEKEIAKKLTKIEEHQNKVHRLISDVQKLYAQIEEIKRG